jgi:formate/nitrite transporter
METSSEAQSLVARTPAQIMEFASSTGVAKCQRGVVKTLILAFFAGAYIGFGAEGSNMAAFQLFADPSRYGLARIVAGLIFTVGLMLVLVAGAELFTGNCLIIVSVLDKKVRVRSMLKNWLIVYIGNLLGSLFIACLMVNTGLFSAGGNVLGGEVIKIAAGKTSLGFEKAVWLGIGCNWLVCLAVWCSYAAKGVVGKFFSSFFIIGLFVISGFEHSVANMTYMSMGIFANANPVWHDAAVKLGTSAAALKTLNWFGFFVTNLIPVTIGNIIGGSGLVGVLYWFGLKPKKNNKNE